MHAVLYYLGLACFFTHELDAVTHAEWRLLYVLGNLPDVTASPLFVALHVPLFFTILWLSHHRLPRIRDGTRTAVSAFLVVHAVLHFSLSSAPHYEFHGALSKALIVSAAAFGFAHFLTRWRSRRRTQSAP